MSQLSYSSQKLLDFMREDYIEHGYMYSGSWPFTSLKANGFSEDDIAELHKSGFLQRRDCEEYAFELSSCERGALISKHDLCSVWYEAAGKANLWAIQEEARNAAGIFTDKGSGLMTVSAVKAVGDSVNPDKIQVTCPFSIGQIIDLEYDLPKKGSSGYSHRIAYSSGKSIGEFMVTNVVCNMVISPMHNMIEIQSLSDAFNSVHPNSRTMLLPEDFIVKRMKQPIVSLDAQIKKAETKGFSVSDQIQPRRSQDERMLL